MLEVTRASELSEPCLRVFQSAMDVPTFGDFRDICGETAGQDVTRAATAVLDAVQGRRRDFISCVLQCLDQVNALDDAESLFVKRKQLRPEQLDACASPHSCDLADCDLRVGDVSSCCSATRNLE